MRPEPIATVVSLSLPLFTFCTFSCFSFLIRGVVLHRRTRPFGALWERASDRVLCKLKAPPFMKREKKPSCLLRSPFSLHRTRGKRIRVYERFGKQCLGPRFLRQDERRGGVNYARVQLSFITRVKGFSGSPRFLRQVQRWLFAVTCFVSTAMRRNLANEGFSSRCRSSTAPLASLGGSFTKRAIGWKLLMILLPQTALKVGISLRTNNK